MSGCFDAGTLQKKEIGNSIKFSSQGRKGHNFADLQKMHSHCLVKLDTDVLGKVLKACKQKVLDSRPPPWAGAFNFANLHCHLPDLG